MILADYPIAIPHRTPQFTKAALKYAADLLDGWDLCVRVIQVHVIPYGVPLDAPAYQSKKRAATAQKACARHCPPSLPRGRARKKLGARFPARIKSKIDGVAARSEFPPINQ